MIIDFLDSNYLVELITDFYGGDYCTYGSLGDFKYNYSILDNCRVWELE